MNSSETLRLGAFDITDVHKIVIVIKIYVCIKLNVSTLLGRTGS